MRLLTIATSLLSLAFLLMSCAEQKEPQKTDPSEVVSEVEEQVWAFHAADTSRNAKGVIDLLWPEYTMLADGHRITYEDVKTGSEAFMATLEVFHTKWTDLKVIPMGSEHAISSFVFSDSLIAKDGTVTQSTGPNTFVWEKRGEKWKVIYGDADHYPVEE